MRLEIWLKAVPAIFALAMIGTWPLSAFAVDVINADATAHEIIVNADNGDSRTLTLAPHQRISGICESCVIVLGRNTAEASNAEVVKISDGKVSVRPK